MLYRVSFLFIFSPIQQTIKSFSENGERERVKKSQKDNLHKIIKKKDDDDNEEDMNESEKETK